MICENSYLGYFFSIYFLYLEYYYNSKQFSTVILYVSETYLKEKNSKQVIIYFLEQRAENKNPFIIKLKAVKIDIIKIVKNRFENKEIEI